MEDQALTAVSALGTVLGNQAEEGDPVAAVTQAETSDPVDLVVEAFPVAGVIQVDSCLAAEAYRTGPFDQAVEAFLVGPSALVEEAFQVDQSVLVEEAYQVDPFYQVEEAYQDAEEGLASVQVVVEVAVLAVAQVALVVEVLAFFQVAQASGQVVAADPAFDPVVAVVQVEEATLRTSWLAVVASLVASVSEEAVAQAGLEVLAGEACLVAVEMVDPSAEIFLVEAFLADQVAYLVVRPPVVAVAFLVEVAEASLVEVADQFAAASPAGPCRVGVEDQVENVEASGLALGNQAVVR